LLPNNKKINERIPSKDPVWLYLLVNLAKSSLKPNYEWELHLHGDQRFMGSNPGTSFSLCPWVCHKNVKNILFSPPRIREF